MVKQQSIPAAAAVTGGIPVSGRLRKRRPTNKRLPRAQALRMLSQEAEPGAAEPSAGCSGKSNNGDGGGIAAQQPAGSSGAVTPGGFINGEGSEEFLSTGRTGRRNAMPDILGQHAETGTADLPEKLEALTTDPAGTSGARSPAEPGPSQQQQQHAG